MSRAAAPERQATLSTHMSEAIRSAILRCRLPPNTRLRLEELRARYCAGASPLREALMRLEAESLVMRVDHPHADGALRGAVHRPQIIRANIREHQGIMRAALERKIGNALNLLRRRLQ